MYGGFQNNGFRVQPSSSGSNPRTDTPRKHLKTIRGILTSQGRISAYLQEKKDKASFIWVDKNHSPHSLNNYNWLDINAHEVLKCLRKSQLEIKLIYDRNFFQLSDITDLTFTGTGTDASSHIPIDLYLYINEAAETPLNRAQ